MTFEPQLAPSTICLDTLTLQKVEYAGVRTIFDHCGNVGHRKDNSPEIRPPPVPEPPHAASDLQPPSGLEYLSTTTTFSVWRMDACSSSAPAKHFGQASYPAAALGKSKTTSRDPSRNQFADLAANPYISSQNHGTKSASPARTKNSLKTAHASPNSHAKAPQPRGPDQPSSSNSASLALCPGIYNQDLQLMERPSDAIKANSPIMPHHHSNLMTPRQTIRWLWYLSLTLRYHLPIPDDVHGSVLPC